MLAGDPIVLGHGPRRRFRQGRVLLGIASVVLVTTATTAVVLLGHGSGFLVFFGVDFF